MANKYSIEDYRKKIKRKKLFDRLLVVIFIMTIITVLFFFFRTVYLNGKIENEDVAVFPISLKNENPKQINVTNASIVVTTDADVSFYSEYGEKVAVYPHTYTNAITKVNNTRAVTYDQGGYLIRVDTRAENLTTIKTDTTILFCEINEAGYLAVAKTETRYTSSVTIYDNNYNEVCVYYTNEYVMGLDFKDNKECVLITQQTKNGSFDTVMYEFNFNKEVETAQFEYLEFFALDIDIKTNSNIMLISNNQLMTTTSTGEKKSEIQFNGALVNICSMYDKYTIISTKNIANPNYTDLNIFDSEGMLYKQTTINGQIKDVFCDEKNYIVLDENQIYLYSFETEEESQYENKEGYKKLVKFGNAIYAISEEVMEKIELN